MSASVNRATLVGRLGADPELRTTTGGSQVCDFRIATDESWLDKQGNRQEKTEWHRIVCWGKLAGVCGEYLRKGSLVYLEGKIETRSWDDKDGNKRWSTEIKANTVQFLSPKSEARERPDQDGAQERLDDIPF